MVPTKSKKMDVKLQTHIIYFSNSNEHFLRKQLSWGDGSVGQVFATEVEGLGFDPYNTCKAGYGSLHL